MTETHLRVRLLLVDDDARFRRVTALRLEAEGYDVDVAASGELDQVEELHLGEQVVLEDRSPEINDAEEDDDEGHPDEGELDH